MSRFYGDLQGQSQTPATRRGSAASGISAHPRGWDLGVRVTGRDESRRDTFGVEITRGSTNPSRVLWLATVEDLGDGYILIRDSFAPRVAVLDATGQVVMEDPKTCSVCGYVERGIGDHDDVVALCTDHTEGPFCGSCFDDHATETGCGTAA